MKKKITVILFSFWMVILQAQKKEQFLQINLGSGMNELSYTLKDGMQKGLFGYSLNATYSYFFTLNWGVQTGIGLQTYSSLSTLNLLTTTFAVDTDGDLYTFKTHFKNWQEKQRVLFLEIPLTVQMRQVINDKFSLLASTGAKLSIPIKTSFTTTGGELVTSGYYDTWNVELTDMQQHGFSTNLRSYQGAYTLKSSGVALIEIGGLYKLVKNIELYSGMYVNYGLSNLLSPNSKVIYQFDGVYNGILNSNQISNAKTFAFGLKVGLLIGL